MIKWLVTGAAGMLGRELVTALEGSGESVTGLTRQQLDVTDPSAVRATVRACRPDYVVNCAAWTAVDDAESHEDAALAVNGRGPGLLAAACAENGARLLHISTDYVFAGGAGKPYAEDDVPAPRTAYGRTKLAGERAVLQVLPDAGYVLRTAWLYGAYGPNFVHSVIMQERTRLSLRVVDDQRGQPTWTADAVGHLLALARSAAPAGIYHLTSSGETSWFGLAREIFRLLGADPARVRPVDSRQFPRPASRPAYSVLGHDGWARAGLTPLRDWRLSLSAAIPTMTAG